MSFTGFSRLDVRLKTDTSFDYKYGNIFIHFYNNNEAGSYYTIAKPYY